MNIAPSVMATMRMVVKIEAMTIFIRLARHIEAAERRIAQLSEKLNALRSGNEAWNIGVNASRLGQALRRSTHRPEAQRKPDQSSATSIESLGFDGSYFTLAGWPATSLSKRICPSRPVISCAV